MFVAAARNKILSKKIEFLVAKQQFVVASNLRHFTVIENDDEIHKGKKGYGICGNYSRLVLKRWCLKVKLQTH